MYCSIDKIDLGEILHLGFFERSMITIKNDLIVIYNLYTYIQFFNFDNFTANLYNILSIDRKKKQGHNFYDMSLYDTIISRIRMIIILVTKSFNISRSLCDTLVKNQINEWVCK